MSKSNKRIKIERELFSKSIRDIEEMFNLSHLEQQEVDYGSKKRKLPEIFLERGVKNNQIGSNPSMVTQHIQLEDSLKNEVCRKDNFSYFKTQNKVETPTVLQTTRLFSSPVSEEASLPNFHHTQKYLDFYLDDDIDYYNLGVDAKSYLPRLNLESDLKLIDQMFTTPLLTRRNMKGCLLQSTNNSGHFQV